MQREGRAGPLAVQAVRWLAWLEFFQESSGDYSMTRLASFLCCVAGCVVAVRSPEHWQTVTGLIGGGAVALLTRTKVDGGGSKP